MNAEAAEQARSPGRLARARSRVEQSLRQRRQAPPRQIGSLSANALREPAEVACGVLDTEPLSADGLVLEGLRGFYVFDWGGNGLRWERNEERFVLLLDELRISSNMRRELKRANCRFTFDRAPHDVVEACADREHTWLSERMQAAYLELFDRGLMHTAEAWHGDELVAGVFGLAVGRVWTGNSMFHCARSAGTAVMLNLAMHLRDLGYTCYDSQERSPYMERFGGRNIPIDEFRRSHGRRTRRPGPVHE